MHGGLPLFGNQEDNPLAIIEKKPEKKKVDEEMVDRIVAQTQAQKPLKERIYDQINVPIWLLDIVIVACLAGLAYIIFFKRA